MVVYGTTTASGSRNTSHSRTARSLKWLGIVSAYSPAVRKRKWWLECPRNNQIFFSVRTETNRNTICFSCFLVCFAKPKKFFSVCFGVLDRYRNNQNKQNFIETNRKNLIKRFLLGVLKTVHFFSRFKPKQTCLGCFRFVFCETNKFVSVYFGLFRCFGLVSKQPKQTELMVWGIKGDI
jgi:hypothetical protein